jgi:uncharacterized membrane protein
MELLALLVKAIQVGIIVLPVLAVLAVWAVVWLVKRRRRKSR